MSDARIILVAGAAGGQQGSTGAHVATILTEAGHKVRALVHTEDRRADALRHNGAEVFVGDLLSHDSMKDALHDVSAVYFAYPVQSGLLHATSLLAILARDCGVENIVSLSQASANPNALSPTSREHWLSERILDLPPVAVTHLRGAVFFENIFRHTADHVAGFDEFAVAMGTGNDVLPSVAATDIADVAASILQSPKPFAGKTLVVTGPEVLSPKEMAATWSTVVGREVRYAPLDDEEQRKHLLQSLGSENPVQIEHLSKLWTLLREAHIVKESQMGQVSPVYQKITGKTGTTWKQFLTDRLLTQPIW